ncbi:MAG: tRNA (adenosine(37)-N6)-threonylcarbamoyltransferase complex transferase subunit TsaD [Polyangiales bacterium]
MISVLGIESSCDETAAAIVRQDGRVLSNIVASQVKLHEPYGGVVPELASRAHMQQIVPVVKAAVDAFQSGWSGIDAIAVTHGPGLVGSLLVGVQFAKALAWSRALPWIGVDHLEGHLLSPFLLTDDDRDPPTFPYIALLVSGGHTALYLVQSVDDVEQLGQTRDDAVGEAYDKVAKLLGLGYPGGPIVDRLAALGDPEAVQLPRPMASTKHLEFSFSGIKTAVARYVETHPKLDERAIQDLCASFQSTVVDVLVRKSIAACEQTGTRRLVITGGVAANSELRHRAVERCKALGIAVHLPSRKLCTDNAAMIAYAGAVHLVKGESSDLGLEVFSRDRLRRRGKFRADGTHVSNRTV